MKYLNLILVLIQAFLLSCTTNTQVAGSGGSETTNGICAYVYQPNGKPAANSKVRLRQVDYDALVETSEFQVDSFTDSNGYFHINDIKPCSYYIEVQSDSGAILFSSSVNQTDTTDLGSATLEPFAALKGSVDSSASAGKQLFARIKGLERLAEVQDDGSFLFDDLPAGYYKVIIDTRDSISTKEIINIKATSNDTTSITVSGDSRYSGIIYYKPELSEINPGTTITNFPLVIRLNSSTFDFELANLNGSDIHFVKPDGKPLSHEIEQWNPTSKIGVIWVSIDSVNVDSKEPFIIMKWGLSNALSKPTASPVFDTSLGFIGTWHLNENPSDGVGAIKDHTENGFHGTCASTMNSTNVVSGICGSALSFDGIDDSIDMGLVNITNNYSLSCWVNIADSTECSNLRILIKEPSFTLWYDTNNEGVRSEHFVDNGYVWRGFPQDVLDSAYHPLDRNSWYYLTSTFDGEKIRLYINGEVIDSTLSMDVKLSSSTNPLLIGGRTYAFVPDTAKTDTIKAKEYFKGYIDEVRVENTARSPEWIKLCYISQLPESNFTTCKTKVW